MRELTAPAEPQCLDAVHELLAGLWDDAGAVPDDVRNRFAIAVAEIVANVVEHGRGPGGEAASLTVRLDADAAELVALVVDDGPAFDAPDDEPDDVWAESGRGLRLAPSAADKLVYRRRPRPKRCRITLRC